MNDRLDRYLTGDGAWLQPLAAIPPGPQRRALFLDRDGVLVDEVGYLHRPEDLRPIPGVSEALRALHAAGWLLVIATNQSGIGRGLFGWADFAAVQTLLLEALGAPIAMVLACPFHPEGLPPYRHADHPWRKPRPGMLLEAARRLPIDLARSWIVGDQARDMAAGRAAGLAGGIHLLTGHGRAERPAARRLAAGAFRILEGESLRDLPHLLEAVGPPAG